MTIGDNPGDATGATLLRGDAPTDFAPSKNQPESVYAWSMDQAEESTERYTWGITWQRAGLVILAAAMMFMAILGIGWTLMAHHHTPPRPTSTPTAPPAVPPIPSGPGDRVFPSTSTPTPTVAAPPPTETVTVIPDPIAAPPVQTLAPPRPSAAALDEQYLDDLSVAGILITNVPEAITGGREVCAFLAEGHTEPEAVQTAMGNNVSKRANAITVVDAAIAVYCPQHVW
jgi:Protein of unknown function (DUF732)